MGLVAVELMDVGVADMGLIDEGVVRVAMIDMRKPCCCAVMRVKRGSGRVSCVISCVAGKVRRGMSVRGAEMRCSMRGEMRSAATAEMRCASATGMSSATRMSAATATRMSAASATWLCRQRRASSSQAEHQRDCGRACRHFPARKPR